MLAVVLMTVVVFLVGVGIVIFLVRKRFRGTGILVLLYIQGNEKDMRILSEDLLDMDAEELQTTSEDSSNFVITDERETNVTNEIANVSCLL
jgi:hypothetical protein